MIDDIAFLYSTSVELDAIGNPINSTKKKQVMVRAASIASREYAEASTLGNKPEQKLLVFFGDYEGEELIEFHNVTYRIYRTYFNEKENAVELYLTRRLHYAES